MDIQFKIKFFSFTWNISISKEWARFTIIVATVAGSLIIPYWGSKQLLMLVLVLLGGIVLMLVLLQKPNLGFLLILIGGMFVPFTGPSGTNIAVLMVALLIGLWFLDMLVIKRSMTLINSPLILPVTMFLIISVIAFGMGQISWFTFANQAPLEAQAGGFAIFVLSAGALLVTAHLIQDEKWLQIIVWFFIGLGTIYVLGRAFSIPQADKLYQRGFTAGSMFWTWLVALTFSQVVFNTKLRLLLRILLGLVVLLTIYIAYVQANDWKSGWVPPFMAIAVILGLRYKRLVIFAIPIALILVAYSTGILIASDEYSWGTRVDAWMIVLEISKVNPLLGLGFSNYYWYTPLFPIRGWSVSFNSHSQYVDLIAQVGILGLLCFLWIFFESGRLSWKLSGMLPDGFVKSYSYGVLAGVIGSLLAGLLVDWILPFVYNIGFTGFRASILPWLFIGGLVSIEKIYYPVKNPKLARSQ